MKEDFLRPPQSVAEYGADAVRVIGIQIGRAHV